MLDTLTALVASIAVATAAGLTLAPLASGLKNGVGEELSTPDTRTHWRISPRRDILFSR